MSARLSSLLLAKLDGGQDFIDEEKDIPETSAILDDKAALYAACTDEPPWAGGLFPGISRGRLLEFAAPLVAKYVKVSTTKPQLEHFKATVQDLRTKYFKGLRRKYQAPPVTTSRIYTLLQPTNPSSKATSTEQPEDSNRPETEDYRTRVVEGIKGKAQAPKVNASRIEQLLEVTAKPNYSALEIEVDEPVLHLEKRLISGMMALTPKSPVYSINRSKIEELLMSADVMLRSPVVTQVVDEDDMLMLSFTKKVLCGMLPCRPKVPVKSSRSVHLLLRQGRIGGVFKAAGQDRSGLLERTEEESGARKIIGGLAEKVKAAPVMASRILGLLKKRAPEHAKIVQPTSKTEGGVPCSFNLEEGGVRREVPCRVISGLNAKPYRPPSSARYMQIARRTGLVTRPRANLAQSSDPQTHIKEGIARQRTTSSLRTFSERITLERLRYVETAEFSLREIGGLVRKPRGPPPKAASYLKPRK
jgi:hypothetical protein